MGREWDTAVFWQSKSALSAACLGVASPAGAADRRIRNADQRNANGAHHGAICAQEEFLQPACTRFGSAPASAGTLAVTRAPPCTYVQALHDGNDNRPLNGPGFLPTKGMGFSRDAPMRFGSPRWDDARLDLTEGGATVSLTMRYFQ